MFVPGMLDDGEQPLQETTSVNGFKAANGFWEQRADYDWSVLKTVSEEAIALPIGESTVLTYEIAVERELAEESNVFGCFGGIYVINSGSEATEDLAIVDTVLYSLDGGESYEELVTVNIDTSVKPILQADGDFFNYPYLINFEPIDGALYLNRAVVTISNGEGYFAEQAFSLPEEPLILSQSDMEAIVSDQFDVPAGWSIVVEDEGPWPMSDSGLITFNVTVTNEAAQPGTTSELVNLATVIEEDTERTSTDDASVMLTSVGLACINVTKTGPNCAWEGKTVTYTITVTNCGEVDLTAVSVIDQTIGFYKNVSFLAAGQSLSWEVDFVIPQLPICVHNFCNHVDVVGWYFIDGVPIEYVMDSAEWCMKIWRPGMSIDKWTDYEMLPEGHPITYYYTVYNTGDSPLFDVRVYDDKLGWFTKADFEAGNGTLVSGDSWSFSVPTNIPVTGELDRWFLCNVATAYGDICDGTWSASTEWCVEVVRPDICVTKWSPYEMITPGHTVTYYINVTNCGNIDLADVYIEDSLLGTFTKLDETEDGVLEPGETWYLMLDYCIGEDNGERWTLCNEVTAWGFVCHDWVSDWAEWCIDIVHPCIDIVKTVDHEMIVEGHNVTYTVTVENCGDVALENVMVYDDLIDTWFLLSDENGDGILEAGEIWEFSYEYTIPVTELDYQYEICNTATVSADLCHATLNDCDSACVIVVHPCIDIEKCVDYDTIVEGHTVTYKICVTNCGDVDLENVMVYDDLIDTWFYLCDEGDKIVVIDDDCVLSPGETWCFTYQYCIPVTGIIGQYQICNTATVYADICHATISDNDSVCVTVVHPCIDVTKWSPYTMLVEGHPVTYYINVTNCGDVALDNVRFWDSLIGWVYMPCEDDAPKTIEMGGTLLPGETWYYQYEYTVPEGVDSLCNEVTAYGDLCHGTVNDSDSWCIDIVHPCIDIKKCVDYKMIVEGHNVTYTVTVENCGDVALENVMVYDSLVGWFLLSDENGDGILEAGEVWEFSYEYTIPETALNYQYEVCNTATVYADICHITIQDCDSACVTVVHPCIDIEKCVDYEMIIEGHTVTYTVCVTNCGDVDLENVRVYDDLIDMWFYLCDDAKCPPIGQDCILSPGETWCFSYQYTIPVTCLDYQYQICNTATVYADICHATIEANDTACVTVVHPCIEVTKWSPFTMAVEGHEVYWLINVTNCGDVELYDVAIQDWIWVDLLDLIIVDVCLANEPGQDGILCPGETWTYQLNFTVPETCYEIPWCLCNEVWAWGWLCHGPVWDYDSWCIEIVHPCICVEKTCEPCVAVEGHPIQFTVTVRNCGDVALEDVYFYDELLDQTFYMADYEEDGTLAPGECWTMVIDWVVPEDDVNYQYCIRNVATAYGGVCHAWYNATDCCCIRVVHPCIDIEKWSPYTMIVEDHLIPYYLNVTNCGDVELYNVRVYDTMFGWLYLYDMIDDPDGVLMPGEWWNITLWYYVEPTCEEQPYQICNMATVYGDLCHATYTDFDCWCIMVYHPCIDIEKTANMATSVEGHPVTYTINVTNCGDSMLHNVRVYDCMFGWFYLDDCQDDGTLNPGESWVFTIDYTIPDRDPCVNEIWEVCNTATAYGDFCHATLTDEDCWCIKVVHPDIALDKCVNCEGAEPGDTVTYKFTVTNTGDIELKNIVVEDTKIGMVYNVPVCLMPGECYGFTWDFTIPQDIMEDPFCNWATATGYVITEDNCHEVSVKDCDCAVLDIMHPSISVLKFGPEFAQVGDIVIFSIWVQNTGDVPLYNVELWDGPYYWCLGDLDIGKEKVRYAVFCIDCETPDPFCNEACASAKYWSCVDQACRCVRDDGCWCMDIVHPSIDIEKYGPESIQPCECGEMPCCIEYTFVVTNDGDVPLTGVVVEDEMLGLSIYIGDLAVGEQVIKTGCYELAGFFEQDVRCPCPPPQDCIVNTAKVTGFFLTIKVCDSDTWTTWIITEDV
jgi:uncharacterized repeat protein (TIGR01451 family)